MLLHFSTALRDYTSEAEKHCLLRLPDIKPSDCTLWSDHLPKDKSRSGSILKDEQEKIAKLDHESIQKQFESDCYKVQHDVANFAQYADALSQGKRSAQLAKICHLRAESKRGSNVVVEWMQGQCQHEVGLYQDKDVVEAVKKALGGML